MRRIGLVLLAIGLVGFLFASAQKSRFETGTAGVTAEPPAAAEKLHRWETARWL